ncbi:MAG TPA: nuclease, partial [Thermoanaerobaculia bacterium]|nr:nuclease [Thermoanaerobaculia bacterium]
MKNSSQFSILNSQFAAAALALLFATQPALAWGEKGHLISNEAATLSLPTDMPHFFLQSFPELVWLGPEPDRWRSGGETLEKWAAPDHFID